MALTKHILIDSELEKFICGNKAYPRETPNDVLKRKLGLSPQKDNFERRLKRNEI